jgi:hypothetical protein
MSIETDTILFIIAIVLSFGIMAFGSKTASGLDRSRRRRHVRRFALMALIPICVVFIVTLPVVIDYSVIEESDPIHQKELTTLDDVSKSVSSQSYKINLLQHEVLRLRRDLKAVNDYYHRLVYGLLFGILMLGTQILISEFGEPEEGEIKKDPLDLKDDPTE